MSRTTLSFLALITLFSALGLETSTASAQGRAAQTQPNRSGLFLEGGGWFVGDGGNRPWFRAEVGIHLARLTRADLYLQIPIMLTRAGYGYAGAGYSWFGLAAVPGVRGEWTMLNRKGDLAIYLEGGAGLVMRSWSYDYGGGCGGFDSCGSDTYVDVILRAGAGVVYTAPFGLMVSVQPFGFGIAFGNEGNYNGNAGFYDGSFMLGYRWQ